MLPGRPALRASVLVVFPTVASVLVVESIVSPTTAAGAVGLGLLAASLPSVGSSND